MNYLEVANDTSKENDSRKEVVNTTPRIEKNKEFIQKETINNSPVSKEEKQNQYYVIYIKYGNGSGSSFVPLSLNPGLKNDSDYHVSISFDDNGDIINSDKIIVIDEFLISNDNKEMIKKIAGKDNYKEALKEIEDRVIDTKKGLEKEGLY